MALWGLLSIPYCKWYRRKERQQWETNVFIDPEKKLAEIDSAPPSETDKPLTNGPPATPPPAATTSTTHDEKIEVDPAYQRGATSTEEPVVPISTPGADAPNPETDSTYGSKPATATS
jgi:hypothetical protein